MKQMQQISPMVSNFVIKISLTVNMCKKGQQNKKLLHFQIESRRDCFLIQHIKTCQQSTQWSDSISLTNTQNRRINVLQTICQTNNNCTKLHNIIPLHLPIMPYKRLKHNIQYHYAIWRIVF